MRRKVLESTYFSASITCHAVRTSISRLTHAFIGRAIPVTAVVAQLILAIVTAPAKVAIALALL